MIELPSRMCGNSTHVYRKIFDRVARSTPGATYDKVYFTRIPGVCYTADRELGGYQLKKSFKTLGYSIFAPERLSLREQIAIARGASLPKVTLFPDLYRTVPIICRSKFWLL